MSIFHIREVRGYRVPKPCERTLKIIMSPETTGTKGLTCLASLIPPGSTTCSHTHAVDEIMYVASGRAQCIVNKERFEIEPDSVAFAPKGTEHEVRNTGEETLKLICIFRPPLKPEGSIARATEVARERNP